MKVIQKIMGHEKTASEAHPVEMGLLTFFRRSG